MTDTREGTFLSIKEAAERAGRNRKTVYRWRVAGLLGTYEDGLGHPLIKASELEALLAPKPVKV